MKTSAQATWPVPGMPRIEIFTSVDVGDVGAQGADGVAGVLFLDVGVEGIEEDTDVGVVDFVAEAFGFGGGGEGVGFEAVEGLDGEGDVALAESGDELVEAFDGAFPFVIGAAASEELADGGDRGSHETGEPMAAAVWMPCLRKSRARLRMAGSSEMRLRSPVRAEQKVTSSPSFWAAVRMSWEGRMDSSSRQLRNPIV